jgi:hypothetical protein
MGNSGELATIRGQPYSNYGGVLSSTTSFDLVWSWD